MHCRHQTLVLFATFALAGCSADSVGPIKAPLTASLSIGATQRAGSYIVLTNRNGTDFSDQVAKLGGKVTFYHAPTGFATVSGLTSSAAAQLRAITGVSEVDSDILVGLDEPSATAQADASALLSADAAPLPGTGVPQAAILGSWQWDMRLIRADTAWAHGKLGSSSVTVAIIDTGLDYDNRDLNTLVDLDHSASFADAWVGDTTTLNNPAPDTLTISDAEITATRFPTRNPIQDYNGHGTNVGATVSSRAFAFAGVTSKTTLIGVKVLGRNGQGNFSQILRGVLFAADQHADVANMSLGGAFSKAGNGNLVGVINKVFNYAKQQGMLIVTSAGNDSQDLQHNGNAFASFCDAPHVVCVSSVGLPTWEESNSPTFYRDADTPAFYTNFGRQSVTVAAPGGNGVLTADGRSLVPSDGWPWGVGPNLTSVASFVWSFCTRTKMNIVGKTGDFGNLVRDPGCATGGVLSGDIGTSQASPHVAGLAALLIAENGKGQPQQIKHLIERSADDINPLMGSGRINVKNALGL
jgi:hypothetical protein